VKRVLTLGGGPAGLYASLLLKKARPELDVTLIERNPPGATYGWGVVFSDRTLAEFREADQPTYEAITDRFVLWEAIDIHYRGELIRSGGHVFAGIARVALLDILQRRCQELGVRLQFEEDLLEPPAADQHDLVIAADGVHSLIRQSREKVFRPRLESGRSRYIWFGTDRVLDSFTFAFRESEHGLFQAHAYPFDGNTSTFIVETDEATWRRAGLENAAEADNISFCERLFIEELRGHRLRSNRSAWIAFVTVRNRTWHDGNLVLIGDAAHTAHFSIGSGTKLAMEDAISLARSVERRGDDVEGALTDYQLERKPVVERFQEAAVESRTYFENTRRYLHLEPMAFAFHLLTRSGRIDYANLRMRDPEYVDQVDRHFAGGVAVAPPPMLVPVATGSLALRNRVALSPDTSGDARDGLLARTQQEALEEAARRGAGLVLSDVVAVSPEGRITPGSPGLYRDEHGAAWRSVAETVHRAGAHLALRLGHAGRRGSTRPRNEGLDRPLSEGGWPLLSPSPTPYSARNVMPGEMIQSDLDAVRGAFTVAAERAATADIDLLLVHMAHGYLLGSFLSPLANVRQDRYGGDREGRMRFPLEVFRAVRAAWPEERALGATIQATDWAPEGWETDDAVDLAGQLRDIGCAVIEPRAGQTVPEARPRYGRGFLVPFADRIRNEAMVPTLVGGAITTTAEVNTILAGGRADLCILDLRLPR
jgi:anthraniloyl-CoA monooxygenase